jgi:hypothetical protein
MAAGVMVAHGLHDRLGHGDHMLGREADPLGAPVDPDVKVIRAVPPGSGMGGDGSPSPKESGG